MYVVVIDYPNGERDVFGPFATDHAADHWTAFMVETLQGEYHIALLCDPKSIAGRL